MDKESKIERIKERGFKVVRLGKHIRASKGDEVYSGSVSYVFRMIFGFRNKIFGLAIYSV